MIARMDIDGAVYIGEVGEDGLPRGKGSLTFSDGRAFSGKLDYAAQRGSGVWRYPDGSTFRGGFSLCRETPVWLYTDADGCQTRGMVYRFVSEADGEIDREADELCARLCKALRERGLTIEFNARALAVDALLRRGGHVMEFVVRLNGDENGFVTMPEVMKYM
ncbi:MAG: hypothetical protein IJY27_06495 [Clostridia bacterium]|nr:hypothetical protein [Clostridia bacterium]